MLDSLLLLTSEFPGLDSHCFFFFSFVESYTLACDCDEQLFVDKVSGFQQLITLPWTVDCFCVLNSFLLRVHHEFLGFKFTYL